MNFFKSFSIYTLSSILIGGINFFLLPILTTQLNPTEINKLTTIQIMISLLTPIMTGEQLTTTTVVFYKRDRQEFGAYLYAIARNTLLGTFVVFLILVLTKDFIEQYVGFTTPVYYFLPLIIWSAFIPQVFMNVLQQSNQPRKFAMTSVILVLSNIGLSLALIYGWSATSESRIWAGLIAGLLLSVFAVVWFWKRYNLTHTTIEKQKESLRLSLPLIPYTFTGLLIVYLDRIVMLHYVKDAEIGIYNVAYMLSGLMLMAADSFSKAWNPFLFDRLKHKDYGVIKKYTKFSVMMFAAAFVVFNAVIPMIYWLFIGKEFWSGQVYVVWITLGYTFTCIYKIFNGYFYYYEKTKVLTQTSLLKLPFVALVTWFLIRKFGAMGAAYSTMLSMFFEMVVTLVFAYMLLDKKLVRA